MDKKTTAAAGTPAAPEKKLSDPAALLADLPLDTLSEEQLNDLLARLKDAKKQKETEQAETEAEEPPTPYDPSAVMPDPACFTDLDGSPDEDSELIEIVPGVMLPPLTREEADILTGELNTVGNPADGSPADDNLADDKIADTDGTEAAADAPGSTGTEPDAGPQDPIAAAMERELIARRKSQRRLFIILLTVVGIMLFMLILLASYLRLYKPTIDDTLPFRPVGEETEAGEPDDDPHAPDTPVTDDDVPAPAIIDSYARREDVYNFLILGIDRAANLSDVIMIVSYDVKHQDLNVLQIPRDTYIDVGSNYHKINAYFSAAYNRSRLRGEERYRDAVASMKSFLEAGLCIKLDRYVCMDTEGFRAIIDAIGGVDIDVPFDMDYEDPFQDLYIHLKAGYQHLDGEGAEHFVRFRKAYLNGDIGRISAQQLFLTALAHQIKDNLTVSSAVSAAKAVLDYVMTDITPAECGYFAKYALSVDMAAISFTTLPGGNVANPDSGASYYVLYADAVRKLVNADFNVYTQDISEAVFLANNRKFQSAEVYVHEVYQKKNMNSGTVTADDIERDSVDIPVR